MIDIIYTGYSKRDRSTRIFLFNQLRENNVKKLRWVLLMKKMTIQQKLIELTIEECRVALEEKKLQLKQNEWNDAK